MRSGTGLAILLAAVAAAPVPVKPGDVAEIRALVARIYGRYRHDGEAPLADRTTFSPGTLAIAREDDRLLAGEEGDVGADIFLDAQDHGAVTVRSVALTGRSDGKIDAAVTFDDATNRVRGHVKRMVLAHEAAGWRVFDVSLPGQGSYRKVMLDEIAALKKEAAGQ